MVSREGTALTATIRQVMFFAAHTPIESLCTFQYSLVALIPGQYLGWCIRTLADPLS